MESFFSYFTAYMYTCVYLFCHITLMYILGEWTGHISPISVILGLSMWFVSRVGELAEVTKAEFILEVN